MVEVGEDVQVGRAEYLSCAATAKLVRAALKGAFAGDRFSVRSSVYSGGASIHVRWTDGPTQQAVDRVAGTYAGGGFDGMIDLAYHVQAWLLPDGSAVFAYSPGTTASAGMHPPAVGDPPGPDARLVNFGADYVFAEREISPAFRAELEARLLEEWGSRERAAEQHRDPYIWDTLVWRESWRWEYRAGVMLPVASEGGRS